MLAAVAPDDLLDRFRQLQRFAERRGFALLYELARNPARGWFFAEITEDARQLFLIVAVHDIRGGQLAPRVHAHVERPITDDAEAALGVFELARRNTNIEQRAADRRDA